MTVYVDMYKMKPLANIQQHYASRSVNLAEHVNCYGVFIYDHSKYLKIVSLPNSISMLCKTCIFRADFDIASLTATDFIGFGLKKYLNLT